jgi:hypothetical protein
MRNNIKLLSVTRAAEELKALIGVQSSGSRSAALRTPCMQNLDGNYFSDKRICSPKTSDLFNNIFH